MARHRHDAILALAAALAACSPTPPPSPAAPPAPPPGVAPDPDPDPTPPAPAPPRVVRLAAIGDVLPHRRVKASAAARGWLDVFGDAVPRLRQADVAFANLESPIAPDHHRGIHGEVFDAPADLATGLAAAGIDVVSLANNHAFDQGPAGLEETWTRVRDAGMRPVGAGPDCAAARAPQVVEANGIRVAFLATTDLVNLDEGAGDDAPCLFVSGPVCTSDCGPDRDAVPFTHDLELLRNAVVAARERADFVVMSFHWGIEYQTTPLPAYPVLARALTDAGVDVLLGHHPHVLQPVETRTTADGRTAVIAYSLGNFVSNMAERYDPRTDRPERGRTRDGVVLELVLERAADGSTAIRSPRAVPLWTDNRPDGIRVRTLDALARDARSDPDPIQRLLVDASRTRIRAILGPSAVDAGVTE